MGSSGSLRPVFAPTPGFPFSATRAWSEPWGFAQARSQRFRPPLGGKNRVGFRGHARGRKPRGLCGRSVRSSPPPPGSATRLDHREDACSDRRGQARPCLDHLSESRVCCCGCGHLCGHFRGIAAIPGRNRLRLRIANPPSSVRLRPEPLNRRPSRCPGNPGRRGGFFVFSNECLRIARLRI